MKFMRFTFLLLSIFIFTTAYPVSVIFKVRLADRWFDITEKYNDREKQEFILGALIHNISFLDTSENDDFQPEVTLKDIYDTHSAFDAGYKFHSFLTEKKTKLIERWDIYRLITGIPQEQMSLFLKLLEDEMAFDVKLCAKASTFLSVISIGEIMSGVEVEKLAIWHGVLYKYLSSRPSESLISLKKDKRVNIPVSEDTIETWKSALLFFSKNEKIQTYLKDLIAEFETSFEFFKLKYELEKKS